MIEDRVTTLEERMNAVVRRLWELETAGPGRSAQLEAGPPPAKAAPPAPPAAVAPPQPAPPQPAPRPSTHAPAAPVRPKASIPSEGPSFEDLLGGRVLAWVGGAATLLGLVFLLAVGVSSGWIGEGARTTLGGIVSAMLLGLGIWLHEHRGRTDAALAAVSAGIAGSFVTVTVAAQVYDLIPMSAGLFVAVLVGALSTALAVRWEAKGIAGLGIVGALLAPVLAGASASEHGALGLLFVAAVAAAGVLVWMRWDWLALLAFAAVTPQWVARLFADVPTGGVLLTLTAFGAVGVATAVGYDLRSPAGRLRSSSTFLLLANGLVLAAAGWLAFGELGQETTAKLWLAGLAVAHLGIGLGGSRLRRVAPDMALVCTGAGAVLADLAFGLIASGPVLAAGWGATAVGFAVLIHRGASREHDRTALGCGLGAHIGLSLANAVAGAPPSALSGGGGLTVAAGAAMVSLAAACFASARLAEEGHPDWRIVLDAIGLAAVAYLTGLTVDGWQLVVAWSLEAAALVRVCSRSGDPVATWGAAAFAGLAAMLTLGSIATPGALVYGLEDPLAAVASVGALAGVAALGAYLRVGDERCRQALTGGTAGALLFLASTAIVTPFQPGSESLGSVFDVGVRQQGQMVLSVFWALVGVTALGAGLRDERLRPVRLAALALLGVTVAKVFLFDLATLTSIYRVISFIGLGILLLGAAFLWQRMRPSPLSDLRETPAGIR